MSSGVENILNSIVKATKDIVIKEALEELLPQIQQKIERVTFNTEEAAIYLGICEQTLRSMCQEKKLPHVKARGKYLFRKRTLDEWMDQQESENYL